jgi:cell division septation protein DedD
MSDEGFHEFQLGKKQLVFLFMAGVVYSAVVFSLGMWAGQGVRRPDAAVLSDNTLTPDDQMPDPTKVAPNELDYGARVGDAKAATPSTAPPPSAEPPIPADTEVPVDTKAAAPAPPPAAPPEPQKAPEKTPAKAPAAGSVMLQVGAFGDKSTAQTLATKLKAKGYAAFVFTAPTGPLQFKVRVGPMADRAEADKIADRLRKEEGFQPFITR